MTVQQIGAPQGLEPRQGFDPRSGNPVERLIFNHRLLICLLCLVVTALLAGEALKLRMNANFEGLMPQSHPFIQNFLAHKDVLRGMGNSVRIAVENPTGDIYEPGYLKTLQEINDKVYLIPGVDRGFMKSLWMPSVRWTQVTEEGFRGGAVMPQDYDGSPGALEQLKSNVARAGIVGSIVANDQRSSMIFVPLNDIHAETGQPLDYAEVSRQLDEIRKAHSNEVRIHITGYAKLVGDLIDGIMQVMAFFAISAAVAMAIIYWYTRCIRSSLMVLACSVIAVVWELGIVHKLGLVLDPYSILVPFLVFAIGVSHGAQKMNGIAQDVARGADKYVAARYTFRRLFLAGLTALIADAVGFAVLMVIDIPVIRDLAINASIGVAALIFTNLVLLPVLLSYLGVSQKAATRSLSSSEEKSAGLLQKLERFSERRWALSAVLASAVLMLAGYVVGLGVKIGDVDPGAPELRPDSRYNRDVAFIGEHYGLSSDVFAVIVKAPAGGLMTFEPLIEMDRLEQRLQALPAVQATTSFAQLVRLVTAGSFEGSPKWTTINRDANILNPVTNSVGSNYPELVDADRSAGPVIAYLTDHKAETLAEVVRTVEEFAEERGSDKTQFLLAAGTAGIEAATNMAVRSANRLMPVLIYVAVIALCLIAFRNWRAVVVAVVPLLLTTILCEALMVVLGIGIKVATLPVIALGVGIGVDYALYLLSVQLAHQRLGLPLKEAYGNALRVTGKIVLLVGVTLAAGVISWAWSPIKFQADMGILLAFMFLWNMVGALVLIPALSHFLLQTEHVTPYRWKVRSGEGNRPAPAGEGAADVPPGQVEALCAVGGK